MKHLRLAAYKSDSLKSHVATEWQVSKNDNFDLAENIVYSLTSNTVLLDNYISMSIPAGNVYYARVRRLFSDNTKSDWLGPIELHPNDEVEYDDLIAENGIDTPMIFVNDAEIQDLDIPTFQIRTSKMRSGPVGHKSTTWAIYNDSGELVFHRLNDTENKILLTVNKDDIDYAHSLAYTIKAIHTNENGQSSKAGTYKVKSSKNIVAVNGHFNGFDTKQDNVFTFSWADTVETKRFTRIELIDPDTDVIIMKLEDYSENQMTIFHDALRYGNTYILRVYPVNVLNPEYNIEYLIHTQEDDSEFKIVPGYTYSGQVELKEIQNEFNIQNAVIEATKFDTFLGLDHGSLTFKKMMLHPNAISKDETNEIIPDNVPDVIKPYNVHMLNYRTAIILFYSGNKLVSLKLMYNHVANRFSKTSEIILDTGVVADVGISFSAYRPGGDYLYYNVNKDNVFEFKGVNINDDSVKTFAKHTDANVRQQTLSFLKEDFLIAYSGNLLETNQAQHDIHLYDTSTDVWKIGEKIVPELYGFELLATRMINGELLSIPTSAEHGEYMLTDVNTLTHTSHQYTNSGFHGTDALIRLRHGTIISLKSDRPNHMAVIR